MRTFKPNLIRAALLSSGFAVGAMPAMAQDANQNEADDTEVIQVTGIRASLQRAQAIKMDNTSIVEALSAEDIGKLPDTSVAESLARLPGLAGERRNGRVSGIAVRGFNENYVGTTLNGRELLGMGDNRGVEFDLYPVEIVSNILVYKSPEAGQIVQGIGGVVDFQTVSPLNADAAMVINANYEENQQDSGNPDFGNDGHRLSFNYVDQFMDDTLGVALVFANQETPRQEQQFRGWGYATVNPDNPRRSDGMDTVSGTGGGAVLGGHDSFTRSALLERTSVAAVIEYAPNDKLNVKFDALYIDFKEDDVRRGLEEGGPEWGTPDYTITGFEDGLVTSGYYDGFHSVVRNDARSQDSELTTFGLNVEYAINDDWTIVADLSTSEVDKTITDIESYSGVGRSGVPGRPLTARSFSLGGSHGWTYGDHPTIPGVDLTDPNLIRLAGPQAWGGGLAPIAGLQTNVPIDPSNPDSPFFGPANAQDGFVNQPIFDEELDAARVDIHGVIEWNIFSGFHAGINYSDRSKLKDNDGFFLTAETFPGDGPIPNVLGVANLSFIGIPGVLAYDALGLFNSGFYTATDASLIQNDRLGDTYTIEEELLQAYVKVDIDTEIGDMFLKGNFGVQVVDVDQSASGFATTSRADGFTNIVPVSGGDTYTDVLPNINLSLEVAENQFIRFAAAKVLSRPRMDDMRPNNQVNFAFNDNQILNPDPANGPWSGSSGNPELKPLEANQIDLAYENYFADDGFFAASFFYKDLKNWHREGATLTDFSPFFIPGFHATSGNEDLDGDGNADGIRRDPATLLGGVSIREDGLEGFVRGWEFQTNFPFRVVHDALDGFGAQFSYTHLDGELEDGGRVPGLSDELYSLTFYYEYQGFEFRVAGTKRGDFLAENRGLSLALVEENRQGTELWDAQISYDFSESGIEALHGLRLTLQGQNLTDEEDISDNGVGDARQITQFQTFGRNFIVGLNYSF